MIDTNFEEKLPTEDVDIADIVKGILAIQAMSAARQKRPLARGTHAKGVCVRATFEVLDLARTVRDSAMVERLARGIFAKPGVYGAVVRFANGASSVFADSKRDVRALSFAVDVPAGVLTATPTRQDFSMNNAPTFPINDAHAFATVLKIRAAANATEKLNAFLGLSFRNMYGLAKTVQAWNPTTALSGATIPTVALLEHRTVSPRTRRRGEVPRPFLGLAMRPVPSEAAPTSWPTSSRVMSMKTLKRARSTLRCSSWIRTE